MTQLPPLPPTVIEPMVRRALDEDFGNSGDLTASLLVPAAAKGKLMMRANPLIASKVIATSALALEESRGGHYRDDFPKTNRKAVSSYITYDMLG